MPGGGFSDKVTSTVTSSDGASILERHATVPIGRSAGTPAATPPHGTNPDEAGEAIRVSGICGASRRMGILLCRDQMAVQARAGYTQPEEERARIPSAAWADA
jgi:hypothetical protein